MIKLNKKPLNYSTHTNFNDDVLDHLATYVVIEVDGEPVPKPQIVNQFEFLARAAHITVNDWDKFVMDSRYIRTRFDLIVRDYKEGWFKRSGIMLLAESGAIEFKKVDEGQPYLHFALSDALIDWVAQNVEEDA